ncbi:hypothetical protein MJN51_38725, partial [Salmonella enterica subsp. enterica serovar Kentucky]|nr:hypothetical protein [Salmonella enterica subsp. enterica serovar Kentucky]
MTQEGIRRLLVISGDAAWCRERAEAIRAALPGDWLWDATRHVLNVKYDMGLFNDPYSHLGPKESDPADTNAESRLHRK